jgi:deoxyadenosine/deoxycytidine kinase
MDKIVLYICIFWIFWIYVSYIYNKNEILIIHICGSSGSGKTTLGHRLYNKYGSLIIIKDIDNLRHEFINTFYKNKKFDIIDNKAYQEYIFNYINTIKKPLVFVGLNNMPWWHSDLYYNLKSTHNFYIDIDLNHIIQRIYKRDTNKLNKEYDIEMLVKANNKWIHDYKLQKYQFLSQEEIYKKVSNILDLQFV